MRIISNIKINEINNEGLDKKTKNKRIENE